MGERIPPPPVADEGGRSSNEQRFPASVSAAGSLLRIVIVGSSRYIRFGTSKWTDFITLFIEKAMQFLCAWL
jgi:hypothetical protein